VTAPAVRIDPEELLLAYRLGIFPMGETRNAHDVLWVRPRERGILPLNTFHVPHRLARTIRSDHFTLRVDTAFGEVIRGCAATERGRGDTWITQSIIEVFEALHTRRMAHSVECWREDRLVGGLYGLSLGGVFFAESKFSRERDASKVALVHLAARLIYGGYTLLDAQFPNPHLEQFGAIAISEAEFEHRLNDALAHNADFYSLDGVSSRNGAGVSGAGRSSGTATSATGAGSSVLQVFTQRS
jgi:leucyl/phenylalanyl-tRNA--protein transferase